MKRKLLFFVFIVFGIVVFFPSIIHAQLNTLQKESTTGVSQDRMEKEPLQATPIEYALPYPGMLPDHPLFFLKRLRDSIMEKLISDPTKKMEFYLLQADKRLSMALAYEEKKQMSSILPVIAEDTTYYTKLLALMKDQEKQLIQVPGYLVAKIQSSLHKHIEVITGFTNRSTGQDADRLGSFLKTFSDFSKTVPE